MTDNETLQKLFEAALREPSPATSGPPKHAVPVTVSNEMEPPNPTATGPAPEPEPEPVEATPEAPTLDRATADELGTLLDEKVRKTARKRRRNALITAFVLFGSTGGGAAWFLQSPERIEALSSAIQEIRSVGDVKTIVGRFQKALDKIAVRSQQIDQATAALGVTPTAEDEKDPYMEAEMKEMTGGEGKTVGERNRALQTSFGDRAQEAGRVLKPTTEISEKASLDFTN